MSEIDTRQPIDLSKDAMKRLANSFVEISNPVDGWEPFEDESECQYREGGYEMHVFVCQHPDHGIYAFKGWIDLDEQFVPHPEARLYPVRREEVVKVEIQYKRLDGLDLID
jgi:hypothetical protein